jgi:hypothetical protein
LSTWSTRATTALERIRAEFSYVRSEGHTLAVFQGARRIDWYTFAGGVTNDVISARLARTRGIPPQPNDLSLTFAEGTDATKLLEAVACLSAAEIQERAVFDDEAIEPLKFHECLPPYLQQAVLRQRLVKVVVLNALCRSERYRRMWRTGIEWGVYIYVPPSDPPYPKPSVPVTPAAGESQPCPRRSRHGWLHELG